MPYFNLSTIHIPAWVPRYLLELLARFAIVVVIGQVIIGLIYLLSMLG